MKTLTRRFLFLSLFFCLFSCGPSGRTELKLMSFNIRYGTAADGDDVWDNRKETVIRAIESEKPDLLGVQEALGFQADWILERMPGWKRFGVGRYHGIELPDRPHESMDGESCRIFYRPDRFELVAEGTWWHSDTPDVPGSITWGNSLPRVTTWGRFREKESGKEFLVMNTHFHWDEPYVSNTTGLIMQKWEESGGDLPTVLMGDFNLSPSSEGHAVFCSGGGKRSFTDTWQAMGKSETGAGSFHGFEGKPGEHRIDWILVSPEFRVKDSRIVRYNENGRYPSDHFPVTAVVEF